jgi:hypothetical protein
MTTSFRILTLLLVMMAISGTAAAAELAGTWQGKLQVDPGTALTIQFTFTKKPDGTYSALLNSPDNGAIKNVAANGVMLTQDALRVDVATLSGTYAGTLKGASIDGKWTQEGKALPLVLTQYQKPQLTKAAVETLTGTWNGPLTTPRGTLTFVMRFKTDDKGELQGTLAVPEQGGFALPMSDIEFADNKLSFKIPLVAGNYTATYANGALAGTWKQGAAGFPSNGLPVTLKKGEYVAASVPLKLTNESFVTLSGRWQGTMQLTTPQGKQVALPVVLRFETDKQAQYVGFIDSPDQHASGIPLTEASLAAGKLVVKANGIGVEYRADLSGKTLTGQWAQGPMSNPLTLTKQ